MRASRRRLRFCLPKTPWHGRALAGIRSLRPSSRGGLRRRLFLVPLALIFGMACGSAAGAGEWQSMFDGKKLGQWKVLDRFDYKDHGRVSVDNRALVLEQGDPGTGVRWKGPFPKTDYEVTLEARRVEGDDFFCAITFPVGDAALTLVLGGWDGTVVGLSCIDDEPAVENETCRLIEFEQKRWYRVRLRVTQKRIETWLDGRQVIDLPAKGRKFTLYWEVEPCLPFGLATWRTTGEIRNIRLRSLDDDSADDGPAAAQ